MSTSLAREMSFNEAITDKVKKLILDCLPEDQIQKVLQDQYQRYFTKRDGWSESKSDFERFVEREIVSQIEAKIRDEVKAYLSQNVVFNTAEKAQEIIAAIAPAVMDSWVKSATASICYQFVTGLQPKPQGM